MRPSQEPVNYDEPDTSLCRDCKNFVDACRCPPAWVYPKPNVKLATDKAVDALKRAMNGRRVDG